jgi:hypothetical protein
LAAVGLQHHFSRKDGCGYLYSCRVLASVFVKSGQVVEYTYFAAAEASVVTQACNVGETEDLTGTHPMCGVVEQTPTILALVATCPAPSPPSLSTL